MTQGAPDALQGNLWKVSFWMGAGKGLPDKAAV